MQTYTRRGRISCLAVRRMSRAGGGAIVILTLASGGGLAFGAAVERLTTPNVTARVSVGSASEAPPIQSIPTSRDQRYGGPPWSSTAASLANVFDGWYPVAPGATPHTVDTTIRHVVDSSYDDPPGRSRP